MATNNSCDYSPTQYNVQSGGANGTLNNISPSTSGYVLTSNGGSAQPTFQANSGATAIQTIDGNTGSVTGTTVTIETPASSGTLNFSGTSTTMTLNLVDSNNNLAIGPSSSISGGLKAVAIGYSATATGAASLAIGDAATSSGNDSVVIGYSAVDNAGTSNVSIGYSASTSSNGFGVAVGSLTTTGEYGVSLGYQAGYSFSGSGEGNIYIGNVGAVEGNTLRIGTQGSLGGRQNVCYIAGITGATPVTGNTPQVVLCDNAGNLAPISSSTSGYVLTSNGTATPSFKAVSVPGTVTQYDVLVGGASSAVASVGPGTSGQILQSGGASANPAYSTATYPATSTINQILYSSAANVISGLATANGGVFDTISSGVPQVDTTNFSVLSTGVQVKGNNANTSPPAGFLGEQIRATGNPSLSTTVAANVCDISLTAGVWDVTGIVNFVATTGTVATAGISASSATIAGTQGDQYANIVSAFSQMTISIPSFRVTLASTTLYYLVAQSTFASGGSCFGRISATRVG